MPRTHSHSRNKSPCTIRNSLFLNFPSLKKGIWYHQTEIQRKTHGLSGYTQKSDCIFQIHTKALLPVVLNGHKLQRKKKIQRQKYTEDLFPPCSMIIQTSSLLPVNSVFVGIHLYPGSLQFLFIS